MSFIHFVLKFNLVNLFFMNPLLGWSNKPLSPSLGIDATHPLRENFVQQLPNLNGSLPLTDPVSDRGWRGNSCDQTLAVHTMFGIGNSSVHHWPFRPSDSFPYHVPKGLYLVIPGKGNALILDSADL